MADKSTAKADAVQIPSGTGAYEIEFTSGYTPAWIEVTAGDVPVVLWFNGEADSGKAVAATKTQLWPACRSLTNLEITREADGTGAFVRWQ